MPLIGANGGLLGSQRTTTTSTGVGLWTPNEQVVSKRAGVWPLSGDPYFGYNSLLLHMDGSNGSTTFTDSSTNALTVTAVNGAAISTAQSKYGGASGFFDGSNDYLTITTNSLLNFGTGDWTVEFWMRYTDTANAYPCILGVTPSWGAGVVSIAHDHAWAANKLSVTANSHNTGAPVVSSSTLSTATWYHCAVVRSGTSLKIFIDGIQDGAAAISSGLTFDFSNGATRIGGANGDGAASYFSGYLDDLRITKGIARYTSNFTPPTGPFLDVGTGGDLFYPSTGLLLHMDGSNGSTTFTDNSSSSRTVTANGGAAVSTAQSKFGGASAYFNGTSDSLSFTDPALGTGDFTIEMWFKTTSSVQYAQLIGNESPGYSLLINNASSTAGDIALYLGGLVCATSGTSYRDDAWHHIAVTRSGTSVTIWIDGVSRATATSSGSFSGQTNYVGRNNVYTPRNFVGYIDDLRITKGIARYTSTFTPSTTAFPNA